MVFIHVFFCSSKWLLTLVILHAVAYGLTLNYFEDERNAPVLSPVVQDDLESATVASGTPLPPVPATPVI